MSKGKFIALEGIDGAGKSTLISKLKAHYTANGHKVYTTYEPTGSPIGATLRNILYGRIQADEKTIAALFLADRLDHITNEVNGMKKYLDQGYVVISDRYYLSSYAYHVPHVSLEWIIAANDECKKLMTPDVHLYIDITVEESLKRLNLGRESLDIFETEERITSVYNNYQTAIQRVKDEENIAVINGIQSPEKVFEEITTFLKTQKLV